MTDMISMMGLAVGICYPLFVVSRYREERLRDAGKHEPARHFQPAPPGGEVPPSSRRGGDDA